MRDDKRQQIIALGRLGWSLRRIQRAVGVRRETASSYLREAGIVLRPPGGWGWPSAKRAVGVTIDSAAANPAIKVITDPAEEIPPVVAVGELKAAIKVITDSDAEPMPERAPSRSPSASACTAHRDTIELGLARGRNAKAIWQDLVDTSGFAAGYQSVRRFVRKLQAGATPDARVVIETAPGEECQVDYGEGPMVRDPHTGKYRRTRLFVLTLGCSRKSVRLLVFRSSAHLGDEFYDQTVATRQEPGPDDKPQMTRE